MAILPLNRNRVTDAVRKIPQAEEILQESVLSKILGVEQPPLGQRLNQIQPNVGDFLFPPQGRLSNVIDKFAPDRGVNEIFEQERHPGAALVGQAFKAPVQGLAEIIGGVLRPSQLLLDKGVGVFGNIAKKGSKVADDLVTKAKNHFGVTDNPLEAGFITPDGTMLDLSGRHQATGYKKSGNKFIPKKTEFDYLANTRNTDHRELGGLVEGGGTEGLDEFLTKSNSLRVSAFKDGNMFVEFPPSGNVTNLQWRQIARMQKDSNAPDIAYDILEFSGGRTGEIQFASNVGTLRRILEKSKGK